MVLCCEKKNRGDGPLDVRLKRSGVSHRRRCLMRHKKWSSTQPRLLAREDDHGGRIDGITGGIAEGADPAAIFGEGCGQGRGSPGTWWLAKQSGELGFAVPPGLRPGAVDHGIGEASDHGRLVVRLGPLLRTSASSSRSCRAALAMGLRQFSVEGSPKA